MSTYATDAAYYATLHRTSTKYQSMTWLLDELPALRAIG